MEFDRTIRLPYFNKRKLPIDSVVIHYISAKYTCPDNPFSTEEIINILHKYKLSYHYLITRRGHIFELVDPRKRAWHAGVANLYGVTDVNSCSIGTAYIGIHEESPTNEQYHAIAKTIPEIIPYNRVVGHDMVSGDWVRGTGEGKVDPGPNFDWLYFFSVLSSYTLTTIS